MKTHRGEQIYQKACKELSLINKALIEMDNESISFLICQSIKECMYNFMRSYLMIKKDKPVRTKCIEGLVNQCIGINGQFKKIDLRYISCKNHNIKTESDVFCISTQRVQRCVLITNGIKKLIDEEMKTKSNGMSSQ